MSIDEATDTLLMEIRVADVAARAVRAVPGVVRLQPGVLGLLGQYALQAWEHVTGHPMPVIGGVQAHLEPSGDTVRTADGAQVPAETPVEVEIQIVLDGGYHATDVGVAVQHSVTTAITAELGHPVTGVSVAIVSITLDL